MDRTPSARAHWTTQPLRDLGLLVGVAIAYYLGGVLGLNLRLPPATPSVLWPPNALLTVALLSTQTRRWPLCLAAALMAHLFVELRTDWPLGLVAALYLTNCTEAVIAAVALRRFSDAPTRFDSLRRLMLFIVIAVIAAPLVATFADAAAVATLRGEPYWVVWRDRLVSSMLAQLVIVPAGVGLVEALRRPPRLSNARWTEAATLVFALALMVWGPTYLLPERTILSTLSFDNPLVLHLPLILWAAARFGSTGTSLTLLVTTVVSAWSAVHGHPPFQALPDPRHTVLALQLLLIVVALTLLSFTAVIQERRSTERTLAERLEFEALLSRLSAAFVHVPSDRMQAAFEEWSARLGAALNIDCLRLFEQADTDGPLRLLSAWVAPGVLPPPTLFVDRDFPWVVAQVARGQIVAIEHADQLPAEGAVDRASLEAHGYGSILVLPLVAGERVIGTMAFGRRDSGPWRPTIVANLRLVAEVFANALTRKRAEDALRASELMKSSILASLTSGVAVIDVRGVVRVVNQHWTSLMRESERADYPLVHVGDNLLDSFRTMADGEDTPRSDEAVAGIQSVLDGSRERFVFEHVRNAADGPRWRVMSATRLKGQDAGAVITYNDITERRRAELDAQTSRQEIAHVTRVATMGEMAVSLAHQLNQPLAAIMTNAHAADKLLVDAELDVAEFRAILSDIAGDVRRASEVIQRLRELLRKESAPRGAVDLNAAIRDVATLIHSDAVIRNVAVSLNLSASPLLVRGDRVQLQQAVLNLMVNALDAIGERDGNHRRVVVASQHGPANVARVTVLDSGIGLAPEHEDLVFEPFFTTKPNGMGMGLSIVRSIVESHGGTVRARPHEGPGALIEFTIPLERSQCA